MKVFFVENRYKGKISLPSGLIKQLPGDIMLFASVQYLDMIEHVKARLEQAGKRVVPGKARHSKYEFQLLGCGIDKLKGDFNAFLYIGDGNFHPKALVLKNDKQCFYYNPVSEKYGTILQEDAKIFEKKRKGALAKFLSSKNIGVLLSTKPGQKAALNVVDELEKIFPGKMFYLLLSNEIIPESLADFSFVEAFVNTACPRIAYDEQEKFSRPVINIEDVLELAKTSRKH
jgi:2-(3-amino-3-carboxypropyl)histidine synthase